MTLFASMIIFMFYFVLNKQKSQYNPDCKDTKKCKIAIRAHKLNEAKNEFCRVNPSSFDYFYTLHFYFSKNVH
jgi:hypothetical protein